MPLPHFRSTPAALRAALLLICIFGLSEPASAQAAPEAAAPPQAPAGAAPIMPLDEVRVGMKGYGLTVFHGVKIEPFAVEVISVQRDFAPRQGVVWIRCPDERLQLSGPVQGMSGSPIYLWGEGEGQEIGQGGRLIGAFAYGYQTSKDCYAGVQPIENMRAVGQRARSREPQQAGAAMTGQALSEMLSLPGVSALRPRTTAHARALEQLLIGASGGATVAPETTPASVPPGGPSGGSPVALTMPIGLRANGMSELLAPLLRPMGISPVQVPVGTPSGSPPPGIDPAAIRFEPGSVLAIPLAWGDMDLSGTGTVTDVLPDGTVLAFGHAMFGEGPIALPMSTGYVHFVLPSIVSSFKLGGSATVQGAMVRDESSAVVGSPDADFPSSPVRVSVNLPGQPAREYNYRMAQHQMLTPVLVPMLVNESLTAVQQIPPMSTSRIRASLSFAGGRKIEINSLMADAPAPTLLAQLFPPVAIMVQNPHQSMMLESAHVVVDVEPALRVGTLVSARLDKAIVEPGQTLGINVKIQPYGKDAVHRRVELRVPESLPDGDYELRISDAQSYMQLLMGTHPHLMVTTNPDDLHQMVQRILSVSSDAIHVTLQLPQEGLAVGRQEMPRLPSSRQALITSPTATSATPFVELVERIEPADLVIEGELGFTVAVRETPEGQ